MGEIWKVGGVIGRGDFLKGVRKLRRTSVVTRVFLRGRVWSKGLKGRKTAKVTHVQPLLRVWALVLIIVRKACTLIRGSKFMICDLDK